MNKFNWCIVLSNNKLYAVAWNENPSTGWGFPLKRIKEGNLFQRFKHNLISI